MTRCLTRRAGLALLLGCAALGSGCSSQPPVSTGSEYCLSAGQNQAFDCARPAAEHQPGPLRIRDLPIDDETLYARVDEIKRWLAAERARLNGEPVATTETALIPPAPAAPAPQPQPGSDAQETFAAALALAERADVDTALTLLNEYRQLNPEDLSASLLESRILLQDGRIDAAERLLRAELEHHPLVPELYNNLAVVQARSGRLGAAIDTLQQAFATDPSFARIQHNLKQLYSASARNALTPDLPPVEPRLDMIEQIPSP
jgi:tetratricopeptide (TPR) repeat protein